MSVKNVKVLKDFDGYKAGDQVPVPCDSAGVPLDVQWRRRLKDAVIDKCCVVITSKTRKDQTRSGEE